MTTGTVGMLGKAPPSQQQGPDCSARTPTLLLLLLFKSLLQTICLIIIFTVNAEATGTEEDGLGDSSIMHVIIRVLRN